jgi:hypothetical protein
MIRYFLIFLLGLGTLCAQEELPFTKEVKQIELQTRSIWDQNKATIVFTGSSSIRFWKDIQERFPSQQVLNTGFGGSQFSDLALYLDELILDYRPVKVFIYEGDNDIFAKKRPRNILKTAQKILWQLQQRSPGIEIVLISAKPSISRWKFRGKYRRLNRKLEKIGPRNRRHRFCGCLVSHAGQTQGKTGYLCGRRPAHEQKRI